MNSYYYFLLLVIFFVGCTKKDSVDGPNDSAILKQNKYEISSQGDTIVLEATTNFFYIFEIENIQNDDTTVLVVDNPTVTKQNITGDWYSIETELNENKIPNLINLKILQNNTGAERTLFISVQRADNFETAIIKQE